jgi:benzoyl-CoA reductase/2-hydroxyglutaryl-CoA dehydratase subunit BcrC/BadD/HgdB
MTKNGKGDMVLTYMGYEVPESWDFIQYEVFTVIHNMINEDGEVYGVIEQKDRTGKYKPNEIIDNPSVALWQDIIDNNKNRSKNVGMSQGSFSDAAKQNEEAYKEIAGYTNNKTSNTSNSSNSTTSVESLIKAIENVKSSMLPAKRKTMKPLLEKEGLPTKFTSDLPIETLQRVYEVMTKN